MISRSDQYFVCIHKKFYINKKNCFILNLRKICGDVRHFLFIANKTVTLYRVTVESLHFLNVGSAPDEQNHQKGEPHS